MTTTVSRMTREERVNSRTQDVVRNEFRTAYFRDVSAVYGEIETEILVDDVAAINNQIANLLTTEIGSRHFEPEFGSKLPELVFEPCDNMTGWLMESAIIEALQRWMNERIKFAHGSIRVIPISGEQIFETIIEYEVRESAINAVLRLRLAQG